MGDCTSKQSQAIQQNAKSKQQNPRQTAKSTTETSQTQKNLQPSAKYDEQIITKRQDRINEDQNKVPELKRKLELIRNGKYEEAGIKASNAYFEMIKVQKQIQLFEQKIQKSKMEVSKFQARKTVHA